MNDIAKVALPTIPEDKVELIRRTVAKDCSKDEFEVFLHQCRRTGLDPLTRQIYCVRVGGRMAILVSIDGFRLIAERSGKYAGQLGPFWCGEDGEWRDVWVKGKPIAAKVGVLRSDFKEPLWSVARYESYARGGNWNQMPDLMSAKVAEALALRRAFPMELSGLYTNDEMEQAGKEEEPADVTPPQTVSKTPPQMTPTKPQGVYDPESGEVVQVDLPHEIPVPRTADNKDNWIGWGGALVEALAAAQTRAEGEAWVALNAALLNDCQSLQPKAHTRLKLRIAQMRERLPDFIEAPQ
jgi:phage recombination protein Bet